LKESKISDYERKVEDDYLQIIKQASKFYEGLVVLSDKESDKSELSKFIYI